MTGSLVLGIDFGGTKIAAAISGEDASCLARRTVPTQPERGARFNLELGVSLGRALLEPAGTRVPAAVGACTFGVPSPFGVLLSPAVPGWSELGLRDELAAAFACQAVAVANDVKAAAAAESRWGALAGADPALYLNLGTGLAVALVSGGRVLHGANGAAGEIGYALRRSESVTARARPDLQLEQAVSGMALAATAARETGRRLGAAEVFAAASENPVLAAAVDSFVRELCFHLVNLAVTLDPQRIAVGGGIVGSWDRLQPALQAALQTWVPFPPELVLAAFPQDAPLAGALVLAMECAGWSVSGHLDLSPVAGGEDAVEPDGQEVA